MKSIIINCGEIAHLSNGDTSKPISGHDMLDKDKLTYESGKAIIIENGIITNIDDNDALIQEYIPTFKKGMVEVNGIGVIDANGNALTPGFVDSHTHLVWSGDRTNELSLRQQGMTYSEISIIGSGINKTVQKTRSTKFDLLVNKTLIRSKIAIAHGTTTLEAKSGYGLSKKSEIESLKAIRSVSKNSPCNIFSTWLGAHDFPSELSRSDYLDQLINEQLPTVASKNLAKWVDVFCEPGWYNLEETEMIINESSKLGLKSRLHVDEFVDSGGLKLAADLGSVSGDHVAYSNDDSRDYASKAGTMQTFLPGTPYVLGKEISLPIAKCIDENWNFSIASDFNPNCPSLSLPFVGSLLSHRLNIDPIVSLIAVTRNPATTIYENNIRGNIKIGSPADINILWSSYIDGWCQTPGINPISKTIINGIVENSNNTI